MYNIIAILNAYSFLYVHYVTIGGWFGVQRINVY